MSSSLSATNSASALPASPGRAAAAPDPEWIGVVRSHVETLRYGIVQLVVHDGRVTQIERTEKVRLCSPGSPAAGSDRQG